LLAEIEYRAKSAEGRRAPSGLQGPAGRLMNWGQYARHTAIAIGVTFVVAAGIYLATRFLLIG
jgi:hypothetical protein